MKPMDNMILQQCPCGETPIFLNIRRGFTEETGIAEPVDCCDTWYINFDLEGYELYSDRCMGLAIIAWNRRPWGGGFFEYAAK